ncbi:hypothetical protein HELRODRAFT_180909 [Helobdella robusta]|uniref:Uncharacterized protein n=1 Tax=Helobdella robusta TaxID=6412 RepID=T1FGE6_HELRO|nr:hypothetical protein HELRODRAFT_180909 [Helobdella robusta]ESN93382.1 hypothetical protein HELRODRAFT_180909 [Helobdella robusta]
MANPDLIVSEMLWILNDNLLNLESENLKHFLTNNFSHEEKILLSELEILKLDKPKLSTRGNTKLDKVNEIIDVFKYLMDNKLIDKIATFVILNIKKVLAHSVDSISEVVNRKINSVLDRLDYLGKLVISNCENTAQTFASIKDLKTSRVPYSQAVHSGLLLAHSSTVPKSTSFFLKNNINNVDTDKKAGFNDDMVKNDNMWADSIPSPNGNVENPFTLVSRSSVNGIV